MSCINKAILIGNVGKNPEIRNLQSGDRVGSFSLATSESWKDKDGNKQERTQWHNVVVFNQGILKILENYVSKGSKLYVEGSIETRKWTDNNGEEKYTTEIVLRQFNGQITLLGEKAERSDGKADGYAAAKQAASGQDAFDDSDDIPFN